MDGLDIPNILQDLESRADEPTEEMPYSVGNGEKHGKQLSSNDVVIIGLVSMVAGFFFVALAVCAIRGCKRQRRDAAEARNAEVELGHVRQRAQGRGHLHGEALSYREQE